MIHDLSEPDLRRLAAEWIARCDGFAASALRRRKPLDIASDLAICDAAATREQSARWAAEHERVRASAARFGRALGSVDAASLRLSLVDLPTILARLGVRFRGSGARLKISCPVHTEKTPSCSIAIGPSGTLRAHCLGCKWTGDVFALIAAVSGLSAKEDFRRILEIAQGLT